MAQATMSIGAVARMTGINANTLRMWERRYQLGPSKRSAGGQREYSTTDIDHLRLIKKLIDNGMRIGDIAQLPTKTLTSLVLDNGDLDAKEEAPKKVLQTQVVGAALSHYFKSHLRRYPSLVMDFYEEDVEQWLKRGDIKNKELLILQQNSLNLKHVEPLLKICRKKVHVVVLYLYSNEGVVERLQRQGISLILGRIDPERIDEVLNKVQRLSTNLSALDLSGKAFDISLPKSQPRQFDEHGLIDAEAMANTLNCECPPHLTDLIRRLNAFEEYSQTCGAENWKQAAVHACVYSYANQARYLIEKALRAVLDE